MNNATLTLKEGINILTAEDLLEFSRTARISDGGIPAFMMRVAIGVERNPKALDWLHDLRRFSKPAREYARQSCPDKKRYPKAKVWVAYYVKDGEVVGFCRLSNMSGIHIGTLEHLYVPSDQRSLGHATALIAGLGDFAREQGMSLLEAYSTTNMEESFYGTVGKRGFDSYDESFHRIKLA